MDEQKERIVYLLAKFKNGKATGQELEELDKWYQTFDKEEKYTTELSQAQLLQVKESLLAKIISRIEQETTTEATNHQIKRVNLWPRIIAAAAMVLVCLSLAAYFLIHKIDVTQQIAQTPKIDIAPGGNKAILTLANGQQITLSGKGNGKLAVQGKTVITKTADGKVVYKTLSSNTPVATLFNTITTPRGGQYHLIMADGTNVWLNAASSIKYPVAFAVKYRQVEITGEAYFEVAHNPAWPFKVTGGGQTIAVLGTRFDVSTYPENETVRTTLLEGSVKINAGLNNAMIKPGQQAILRKNAFQIMPVDTDEAIAWKEGMFKFNNTPLEMIMQQVSRWYDVDIAYQDESLKTKTFFAVTTRFEKVSQLLNDLEQTGNVKFEIKGKKITVLDK
jgi:transmembrane sensor